jgi:hypothetical protein
LAAGDTTVGSRPISNARALAAEVVSLLRPATIQSTEEEDTDHGNGGGGVMTAERASIFGDDELDVSDFKPKPTAKPDNPTAGIEQVREVAEAANFPSREPKPTPAKPLRREQRRHRTGRNVQLNIKARAEAVEAFYAITDREKWVLGETFERAIYALKRELAREKSPTA